MAAEETATRTNKVRAALDTSRDETGRMYLKKRGKSKRSRRFTPLLDQMLALVDLYIAARRIEANDLIFGNANGNLQRGYSFRARAWKPLVESIGRADATLKSLRH